MREVEAKISHLIDKPIRCHAWSKDGKSKLLKELFVCFNSYHAVLAICPNDENVLIYRQNGNGEWKETDRLEGHDQLVTAMDWSCDDRLLTVSADRNGIVWTNGANSWQQSLVLLRLRRAANCVQWSQDGRMFAVGGAEGIMSIGYYEAENDWWACKHLKSSLDGSAVLAVAWHPSGSLVAISTLAGKVHLVTAHIKSAGVPVCNIPWIQDSSLLKSFDASVGELEIGSWVHSLDFNAGSGDLLALASHDGSVHLLNLASGSHESIKSPDGAALRRVVFLNDECLAVSGYGHSPMLLTYSKDKSSWAFEEKELSQLVSGVKQSVNIPQAFASAAVGAPSGCASLQHQASVSDLRIVPNGKHLSTTGHDGRLVTWNVTPLLNRLGIRAI